MKDQIKAPTFNDEDETDSYNDYALESETLDNYDSNIDEITTTKPTPTTLANPAPTKLTSTATPQKAATPAAEYDYNEDPPPYSESSLTESSFYTVFE